MKRLLFFVLLLVFALPVASLANEIDLQINGVGLGTSYETVLRQIGNPIKSEKGDVNECGGDVTITLHYSGLIIELLGDGTGRNFTVIKVEVTSSKWFVASGITVGTKAKDVAEKFGEPSEKSDESGVESWSYVNKGNDGWAGVEFRDNKIVKIIWESAIC